MFNPESSKTVRRWSSALVQLILSHNYGLKFGPVALYAAPFLFPALRPVLLEPACPDPLLGPLLLLPSLHLTLSLLFLILFSLGVSGPSPSSPSRPLFSKVVSPSAFPPRHGTDS
jgi:hypothetical protein